MNKKLFIVLDLLVPWWVLLRFSKIASYGPDKVNRRNKL